MDFGKLCKDILNLDPKIRFAGVCDETGEIKYGGQREGIKNLLSSEETKRSNLQALARWGLRNSLAPKIGKGKYAMAEYEKIKRITVPLENYHLLLVTTELEADHGKIIDNILKLLQSQGVMGYYTRVFLLLQNIAESDDDGSSNLLQQPNNNNNVYYIDGITDF